MAQAQYGTIVGIIKAKGNLNGSISLKTEKVEKQSKEITITENGVVDVLPDANKVLDKVTITTDVIGGNVSEYKGSYEVTPMLSEQTLSTAKKVMRDDVKIKEIPITRVTNTSGGNTVIIGG